mmetsp:Transcript_13865/g.31791  ORF Transcript_13865/g.31791 Transcript_13865/m.31791 type:complete len:237 (+) Transcript_13865:117-827(+)
MEEGRSRELGKVAEQELARVVGRRGERFERHRLRLLRLRDEPAALVRRQVGALHAAAKLRLERVRLAILHLACDAVVQLRHTLHLRERDELSVLEFEPFVVDVRDDHGSFVHLRDGGDDSRVRQLAVSIRHVERRPKVGEDGAKHAARLSLDEGDRAARGIVADVVALHRLLRRARVARKHDDVKLGEERGVEERLLRRPRVNVDFHRRVEILQLFCARRGSVGSYVRLGEVKLAA